MAVSGPERGALWGFGENREDWGKRISVNRKLALRTACMFFFDMLALVRGCSLFYSLVFLTAPRFIVGRALLVFYIY